MIIQFLAGAALASFAWGVALLAKKQPLHGVFRTCAKCKIGYLSSLSRAARFNLFCSEACETSALMEMEK